MLNETYEGHHINLHPISGIFLPLLAESKIVSLSIEWNKSHSLLIEK